MDMVLCRTDYREDGVFGKLLANGKEVAVTLEHSYGLTPKLPSGSYTCKLSPHRLHGMDHDFLTYEVTGVPGHAGILFHWGNWEKDSEGCILVGHTVASSPTGQMVTGSKATFQSLMQLQAGAQEFTLIVLPATV